LKDLPTVIAQALSAGVDWVQIREKDLPGAALLALAGEAVAEAKGHSRVVINDRLDVAMAARADGVHLGETSLPVAQVSAWIRKARAAGQVEKGFVVGASCHSLESARQAERDGADYIFFGPAFATPSKAAFGAPQGLERLREVCAGLRIPALAIGGITLENARRCIEAGAAGIAAIRLFQNAKDPAGVVAALRNL
jgi:thiamine-phosphate pyrophosphorylase